MCSLHADLQSHSTDMRPLFQDTQSTFVLRKTCILTETDWDIGYKATKVYTEILKIHGHVVLAIMKDGSGKIHCVSPPNLLTTTWLYFWSMFADFISDLENIFTLAGPGSRIHNVCQNIQFNWIEF